MTIYPKDFCLNVQDVFVNFLKKLQKTVEFLEQPIVVSTGINEHRNQQHSFGVDKSKSGHDSHHLLLGDVAQINAF